jgi:phosphatidylglycerophosphatase C
MDHDDHYFYSRIHVQKEKTVKKEIAFFDFDGTITTKDTLLEFIKFGKGSLRFFLGFLLNSPYLVAYKLKIISNQSAKEKVLRFFFRDTPVDVFKTYCNEFSKRVIPHLIRPGALTEIRRLQNEDYIVVVVSASPENWIQPWADEMNVQLLASKLEVKENKITGKILGKNCHGEEKVRRISECYTLSDYHHIVAYGDSSGDKPMLKLAKTSFFKPFRK